LKKFIYEELDIQWRDKKVKLLEPSFCKKKKR